MFSWWLVDFSQEFDEVLHQSLPSKHHHYGIREQLLQWISSFLKNRSQQVLVEGQSSTAAVTSGVAQGTVFDPHLGVYQWHVKPYIFHHPPFSQSIASCTKSWGLQLTKKCYNRVWTDNKTGRDWLIALIPIKCEVKCITNERKTTHGNYTFHGHTLNSWAGLGEGKRWWQKSVLKPTYRHCD